MGLDVATDISGDLVDLAAEAAKLILPLWKTELVVTAKADESQSLDNNLKMQNSTNNLKQFNRLQQRFNQPAEQRKGAPAGGFR